MGKKVGLSCKLYYNTGTFGVPVWTEITVARDVTVNMEAAEAESSSRASSFREYLQALKDVGIEFDALADSADTPWQALKDAYFNNTTLDVVALDGGSAASGSEGLRIISIVSNFTRNEPLEEAITTNVTLKPTPNTDSAPVWFVVP